MRRRPSVLVSGGAAVLLRVLVAASSTQVGEEARHASRQVTLLSSGPQDVPQAPAMPAAPPVDPIGGLSVRARQAADEATRRGADIGFTLLDRKTGEVVSGGDGGAFPIASVTKLFIADDLLLQVSKASAS